MSGRTELARRKDGSPTGGERPLNGAGTTPGAAIGRASDGESRSQVTPAALLRQKATILTVFLVSAGACVPLAWVFVRPEYASTAKVRVAPVVQRLLYQTEEQGVPVYNAYLNSQVSLITSPAVLQSVLERPLVQETDWYAETPATLVGDPPTPIERLSEALTVVPLPGTELIDVTMRASEPDEAALIVNAVVETYLETSDGVLRQDAQNRFDTLARELEQAQDEIDKLIATRFEISERLGLGLPEEARRQLANELNELRASLASVRREQELRRYQLEHERGATKTGSNDRTVDARLLQNQVWLRQKETLENARQALKIARVRYGDLHPTLQARAMEAAHAEAQLRETEQRLAGFSWTLPGDGTDRSMSLRELYEVEARREAELEQSIEALTGRLKDVTILDADLARNEERLAVKKALRDDIRNRMQALTMESKAPGRVSIAATGQAGARPWRDRRVILTIFALGASLMIAVGAGCLRCSTDTSIHEADDVTRATGAPFLGQVPRVRNPLDVAQDPAEGAALRESIRMIRTSLLQRVSGRGGHVVAVTSAGPSAGKTTCSVLLARSLAQLGKRVLLVDADFSRPSLSRTFGVEGRAGLAGVLSKTASDDSVIVEGDERGFALMPAGTRAQQCDSELLANGELAACLRRWKQAYDFVLIDSPPVLAAADARILAGQADGAIMVLRASHCKQVDAVSAYAGLSAAGATLLGTVLVGAVGAAAEYPYDYYHSGFAREGEKLLA